MSDQQSIVVIFDVLSNSAPVTPSARKTIENISRTYPYFIPARYVKALDTYRKEGTRANLEGIMAGYTGNWLLFDQFLTAPPPLGSAEGVPDADSTGAMTDSPFADQPVSVGKEALQRQEKVSVPARKPVIENQEPLTIAAPLSSPDPIIATPYTPDLSDVEDAIIEEEVEIDVKPVVPVNPAAHLDESILAGQHSEQAEADALIQQFLKAKDKAASVPVAEVSPEEELPPVHVPSVPEPIFAPVEPVVLPVVEESVRFPLDEHIPGALPDIKMPVAPIEDILPPHVAEVPTAEPIELPNQPEAKLEDIATPVYTEDYFKHQGVHIPTDVPSDIAEMAVPVPEAHAEVADSEEDKSLMVMLSFEEWLLHFRSKEETATEEQQEQKALKTMWQKEKLAAALEEENDEIPEGVFDMAMTSIAKEDGLASESLADIHVKQGKYDKAIEMLQKLSLRNPEKSGYFARKIEEIKKEYLS